MKRIAMVLAVVMMATASWCETSSVLHWSSMTTFTADQIMPPDTAVPHRPAVKKSTPIVNKTQANTVRKLAGKMVVVYIADASKCPACHTNQTMATIEYLKKQHGAKVITIKPDKSGNWIMPNGIKSFPSYAIYEDSRLIHVQSTGDMIELESALSRSGSNKKTNGPFRRMISK